MTGFSEKLWDITVQEVVLSLVLSLVLGWVVGVMCCVVVIKYMQCMAGKTLIFGPRLELPSERHTSGAVVNPVYDLDMEKGGARRQNSAPPPPSKKLSQARNSRPFHEYSDVLDPPLKTLDSPGAAVTDKTNSVYGVCWDPSVGGRRKAPGLLHSLTVQSSSLQGSIRQTGRKTNAYSELDKKTSYSVLEPHIQDPSFAFKKEPKRDAQNYNVCMH